MGVKKNKSWPKPGLRGSSDVSGPSGIFSGSVGSRCISLLPGFALRVVIFCAPLRCSPRFCCLLEVGPARIGSRLTEGPARQWTRDSGASRGHTAPGWSWSSTWRRRQPGRLPRRAIALCELGRALMPCALPTTGAELTRGLVVRDAYAAHPPGPRRMPEQT